MPSCCLRKPTRAGKKVRASLRSTIQQQINAFNRGEYTLPSPVSQKPASSGNNDNSKLIAAKLDEGDIKGAVRLAANDYTFLPPTLENKTLLDAKHTPAPADRATTPSNDCVQLQISQSEVKRAVMSFNASDHNT